MPKLTADERKEIRNWLKKNADRFNIFSWDDEDDSYLLFDTIKEECGYDYMEDKDNYRDIFGLAITHFEKLKNKNTKSD